MGTRGSIGICEGSKVNFIVVSYDAQIDATGIILYLCYRDLEKIKQLMKVGTALELHNLAQPPLSIRNANVADRLYDLSSKHLLTSYTQSSISATKQKRVSLSTYQNSWSADVLTTLDYKYVYMCDVQRWFVCGKKHKRNRWDLERLLTDAAYLQDFCNKEGYCYYPEGVQQMLTFYRQQLAGMPSIEDTMNAYIQQNDILAHAVYRIKQTSASGEYTLYKDEQAVQTGSIHQVLKAYITETDKRP